MEEANEPKKTRGGSRKGRALRTRGIRKTTGTRLRSVIDDPKQKAWIEGLSERYVKDSPIANLDAKTQLAELAQTLQGEVARLRLASVAGVISADEARALPSLAGRLIKTLESLQVLAIKEPEMDLLGEADD